jgi:hypothetical protein
MLWLGSIIIGIAVIAFVALVALTFAVYHKGD